AFAKALAEARAERDAYSERFEQSADRLREAATALDKATSAAAGAEGRLKSARERIEGLSEKFTASLGKAGFLGRADFDDAAIDDDELAAFTAEVVGYDEELKFNTATIERLSEKLAEQQMPDLESLTKRLTEARQAEATAE